ncbi:Hemolysin III [Entamoeba marina]
MRYVFQRLDHVMIYIMIAGCYSGYILSRVLDKGYKKTGILAVTIFGIMAIFGIVITIFQPPSPQIEIMLYLGMGLWSLILIPCWFYFCPLSLIVFSLGGGSFYVSGVIFFKWNELYLNHCIWHFAVLIANVIQSFGIYIAVCDEQKPFIKSLLSPIESIQEYLNNVLLSKQQQKQIVLNSMKED